MKSLKAAVSRVVLCSAFSIASVAPAIGGEFTGAGSSFAKPLYTKWAEAFRVATGHTLNYQSVGSSAGIKRIKDRSVDFGATDAPLSADELDKEGLIQFPTAIGGVVAVVNLPGIATHELVLNGDVLARIYLGKISRWNDPAIAALNRVRLPDLPIAPVHRADGSGTTFIFTSYLTKVSKQFGDTVGTGTTVKWPSGTEAKGNEGMVTAVKERPGAIGYTEFAAAEAGKLAVTRLTNHEGVSVKADHDAFMAAALASNWHKTKGFAQPLVDMPGKRSWPITAATFVLIPKAPKNAEQAKITLKFFEWAYQSGDPLALELGYTPLPSIVQTAAVRSWASMQGYPFGAAPRPFVTVAIAADVRTLGF
jgi:phosphate transport system substrate-binding protein